MEMERSKKNIQKKKIKKKDKQIDCKYLLLESDSFK